nr:MAG: major capsid protein [Microvirus sp.]
MAIFDSIKPNKVKRNKFSLSHERKFSMNMGDLVPIMCQEIVPGDSFRVNTETLMRLAPMLAPIMHRVNVYTHYFFVPNRLLWPEWEDFITGGRLGTAAPVMPYFLQTSMDITNSSYFRSGSLWDYLGLPTWENGSTVVPEVSVLPFRAYQMIWNEYYRDHNLMSDLDMTLYSGAVSSESELLKLLTLRKRCWEKDYFTSALPFAQRGGEALVPFSAEVNYKDVSDVRFADGSTPAAVYDIMGDDQLMVGLDTPGRIENIEDITAGTTTINDLRRAIKIQEWLERAARGGSRYIEAILSHFGVRSSDSRLQRPEYLGGGKSPVVISEVLSTVGTVQESDFAPQGTMSGHGISVGNRNGFKRSFEEHGYVIGIMSVLPRTSYQQGVPRAFMRKDKFDYYWPEFAHLGEQEVLNQELKYDWGAQNNDVTFGYQSRYAEYKYQPSTVHGDMRNTLDFWHMGRKWNDTAPAPPLNADFVTADPTHRIFAVEDPTLHKLWVQIYNEVDALRPMPFFGEPSLI